MPFTLGCDTRGQNLKIVHCSQCLELVKAECAICTYVIQGPLGLGGREQDCSTFDHAANGKMRQILCPERN